ncbi:MAG: hypothetical protein OES26_02630 [Gammaproteobacteria bacterium]|nr:hypothetical protein [Gammaproteobacteria bacterium]
MLRSLSLSIPKPQEIQRVPVAFRVAKVEQWLDSLPRDNGRQAALKLYQSLHSQNRFDISVEIRLRLLELYREPAVETLEMIQELVSTKPLPLDKGSQELAELVQNLMAELANGYKIAVSDLIDQNAEETDDQKQRDQLLLALQRAIYHLGHALLNAYQAYIPAPSGVWRELNQLYWYASGRNLATDSVMVPGSGTPDGTLSITESFQLAVLLGSSHPYGLFPGDCMRIYRSLSAWQQNVEIVEDLEYSHPGGRYLINLALNAPPVPLVKIRKVEPAENLRMLVAVDMLRNLHATIKNWEKSSPADDGDAPDTVGGDVGRIDLLRRVAQTWSGATVTRKSNRTRTQVDVGVCVGIPAIYYFVNDEQPFAPPLGARQSDNDSLAQAPGWTSRFRREDSAKEMYKLYQCETRDEGAGGFRMVTIDEEKIRVRVGDVVGLEHPSWVSWLIGVVRWLQADNEDTIEFGVQILAPKAQPIAARRLDSANGKDFPFVPGLLLPELRPLRQAESLILPRGTFQPPHRFEIVGDNSNLRSVLPTGFVDRTSTYERVSLDAPPA